MAFFLAQSLWGCGEGAAWLRDDPQEVVRGYLQALDAQDRESACEFLSSKTRAKLDELARQSMDVTGEAERTGCRIIRSSHVVSSTREYRKFEVTSSSDTEAVVDIVLQNDSRISIALHREKDRWAIDLPL